MQIKECSKCGRSFTTSPKSRKICPKCQINFCKYCGIQISHKHDYCGKKCMYKDPNRVKKTITKKCKDCGKKYETTSKTSHYCAKCLITYCKTCGKQIKRGSIFCGRNCMKVDPERRERSSIWMTKLNEIRKPDIIERMTHNNPGSNPKTIEKMKETKRKKGILHIWSGEKGGNGKILPKYQQLLFSVLNEIENGKWNTEYPVNTTPNYIPKGEKRKWLKKNNYPTCYKIDIANPILKIGIEIDGGTHQRKERKEQDLKKTILLTKYGWKILRYTNQEVKMNLSKIISQIKILATDISNSMISK